MDKLKELIKEIHAKKDSLVDPDSFDDVFYDAQLDILYRLGDGGLSEQYIKGVKAILSRLTPDIIGCVSYG